MTSRLNMKLGMIKLAEYLDQVSHLQFVDNIVFLREVVVKEVKSFQRAFKLFPKS